MSLHKNLGPIWSKVTWQNRANPSEGPGSKPGQEFSPSGKFQPDTGCTRVRSPLPLSCRPTLATAPPIPALCHRPEIEAPPPPAATPWPTARRSPFPPLSPALSLRPAQKEPLTRRASPSSLSLLTLPAQLPGRVPTKSVASALPLPLSPRQTRDRALFPSPRPPPRTALPR